MYTAARSEHVLELFGPRRQAWRPAIACHGHLLQEAVALADAGRHSEALRSAEDAWVECHGHMRDVAFRVRTTTVQVSALSATGVMNGGDVPAL